MASTIFTKSTSVSLKDAVSGKNRVLFYTSSGFLVLFFTLITLVPNNFIQAQRQSAISIISMNDKGELGNDQSRTASISSDGRFILYTSLANNLTTADTNSEPDLFLHDRLVNRTIRLVESVEGGALSANGRYALFKKNDSTGFWAINDIFKHKTYSIFTGSEAFNTPILPDVVSLSADSRYIAASLSISQATSNDPLGSQFDMFIYDQVTGYLRPVPRFGDKEITKSTVFDNMLSDDGRTLAYLVQTPPLPGEAESIDLVIYNRVLDQSSKIQLPLLETDGDSSRIWGTDISSDGNLLTHLLSEPDGDQLTLTAIVYNRSSRSEEKNFIDSIPQKIHEETSPGIALSGNGNFLVVVYPSSPDQETIARINLATGEDAMIDQGSLGSMVDISFDGSAIVYNKDIQGTSQVLVWQEQGKVPPSYILSGQVTDSTGHPLALVTIRDDRGYSVRTDGDGYFWINDVGTGSVTLLPEKEGFSFEPASVTMDIFTDTHDILFVYAHDEVLKEAQKDLGMPYSFNRGEIGPFHGYSAGFCTDMVLDAFIWGVDYNIQFALEQDFRAHPWHFYRWRDARNAHDMWRYFVYSNQIQLHTNPYQPGDIVFFDWSEDGEIDHVAIVSVVNSKGRPRMMFDATGSIPSNPSGLAAELPWEYFHERTVRGFARWSGKYEPVIPDLPPGQNLQMALGGNGIEILLIDSKGRILSNTLNHIPGGNFDHFTWEQILSVTQTFKDRDFYLTVIYNPGEIPRPYQFIAQLVENGLVTDRLEQKDRLQPQTFDIYPLLLESSSDGIIKIELGNINRRLDGSLK